ncbi:DNA repair protein RecO [Leptospira fainei serovar Hurstbridge str. BUT 6]|uniref:DNA repair protein RecO n=1 Tax=Leptospira fainei serovar Hurstbridge str. BUT 6 TaxID=1193011 RepID=S3W7W6_9LEPT|nr:DNA repair protein RecO [Leptospira fainei]EPG76162.1 DNA repair protein RecO [Leptospira fainei serovar Hurstbridge str. BUT 6]
MSGSHSGALRKAKGIVMESRILPEGDAFLRLLPEEGEVSSFRVKGIKKSKSRPIAAVEPGSLTALDYYMTQGRDTYNVKEIGLIERFDNAKKGYAGTVLVSYLVELVSSFLTEGGVHPQEYKLLYAALKELDEGGYRPIFLPFFKFKLLYVAGFLSKEISCSVCGKELGEMSSCSLEDEHFDVICGDCRTPHPDRIGLVRLIYDCLRSRYKDLKEEKISLELLKEADRLSNRALKPLLGRRLKSEAMLYESLGEALG